MNSQHHSSIPVRSVLVLLAIPLCGWPSFPPPLVMPSSWLPEKRDWGESHQLGLDAGGQRAGARRVPRQYAEDGQNRIALFTPDELLVAAGDVIDGKVIEHFPHIASEGLNDAGLLGFVARFHDQRSSAPGRGLFTIDLVSGVKRLASSRATPWAV